MTILIYDLNNVLLPLEREVIQRVLDIHSFLDNRETVEYFKTCWVRSRLWKLKNIPIANDPRFIIRPQQIGTIENLARHLETPFYNAIPIFPRDVWVYDKEWVVELLYNNLYLKAAD